MPTLHLLMIASGFAGLGYEMVWTQMLAVALGHEAVAVLAVLVAFFAGLALGAWRLDALIRRSTRPGRVYALLEAVIGCWALALIVLIPAFDRLIFAALGDVPGPLLHWLVAFGGTFALLLPATAAMGATLPAMERVFSDRAHNGFAVGGLYAANTAGAMLGTVAGTFVLARLLGFTSTLMLLAGVNFLCAAIMLGVAGAPAAREVPMVASPSIPRGRLVRLLALTGLLGLGYEVVAIRVLAQVLENTVFTFASLLGVYLLGTAAGAAVYQAFGDKNRFDRTWRLIVVGLAATSLVGIALLSFAHPLHLALVSVLGDGMVAAIAGEWVVATLVFLPPTLFMGASFAHLAQTARRQPGLGVAVAINTAGAALAPVLFGVLLLPAIGSKITLLVIALAYLSLLPGALRQNRLPVAGVVAAAVTIMALPLSLRIVSVPDGGDIVAFAEGRMANVAVVGDPTGARYLKVNNQYTMGGTNSRFSDRRQAHIPLLLHPDPHSALFLGLGTGSTFVTASIHPQLQATAVELLEDLLPMLGHFGPTAGDIERDPKLALVTADARRFVASTDTRYDVVVADVFHPARDGAAALYTREHFAAVRERLTDDGLFCQWLPLFQLDLATLSSIIATFVEVYPDAEMHLAHFSLGQPIVGLIGRRGPHQYASNYLRERVTDRALAEDLRSVRLTDDFALFGGFLAGAEALRAFASGAAINTDDHPIVAWQAPRFLFAAPQPAYVRLLTLIDALEASPADLVQMTFTGAATDSFANRLAAYWRARNDYLRVGVGVTLTNDTRRMLEQIGQPLLKVVETSADFSPAYMPLLQMGIELSESEPIVARALLQRLEQAAPGRPEAARARRQLFAN